MSKEQLDPRWQRFESTGWLCCNCNVVHQGVFDLGMGRPSAWPGNVADAEPNSAIRGAHHILTEDFCILDGAFFFVRCQLDIPVIGAPKGTRFGYGVWSTLAKSNFERYVETFDSGEQDREGPWFGWFASDLPGYGPATPGLKCNVHPRSGRLRPLVELQPTDHPLAVESRGGITLDRLFEIYALHGHAVTLAD